MYRYFKGESILVEMIDIPKLIFKFTYGEIGITPYEKMFNVCMTSEMFTNKFTSMMNLEMMKSFHTVIKLVIPQ